MRSRLCCVAGVCVLTVVACGKDSSAPQTPSPPPQTGVGGATLKTGAPQFLSGGEYSALLTNLSVVSTTEDPKDG